MDLMRLFASGPPPSRFAEGRVGFAVGDIHGRDDLLAALLALLESRAAADRREAGDPIVIFLGDYVDRGPASRAVLDLLVSGRPSGFERRFLMGNHEQSMLAYMDDPMANRAWVLQGGAETMASYGVPPPPPLGARDDDWVLAAERLKLRVPSVHMNFLRGLERYVALGDYAFVHAGVDDRRPLEAQTDDDLFWSRKKFLASKRRFSHRVVHGHTPADQPYADRRRIGLDTGAYITGTLTAARFEGEEVAFLSVSDGAGRSPAMG